MSSKSTNDIQPKINEGDIDEIDNMETNKNEDNEEEDIVNNNDDEEDNEEDNEEDPDDDVDENIVEDEDEDEDDDEFSLDEDGEEVVPKTVGKKVASSKKTKIISTESSDNIMDFLNMTMMKKALTKKMKDI